MVAELWDCNYNGLLTINFADQDVAVKKLPIEVLWGHLIAEPIFIQNQPSSGLNFLTSRTETRYEIDIGKNIVDSVPILMLIMLWV